MRSLTLKFKAAGLAAIFATSKPRPVSRTENESDIQISAPTDFKRTAHISYRAATGLFSGLDAEVTLFFGVAIASQPRVDVVGYDDRIPSILVLLCREMLRRGGLYAEGVFRVPAESTLIAESRRMLNQGRGTTALETESNPHLFASLIKDWCRTLPAEDIILGTLTPADISNWNKDTTSPEETLEKVLSSLSEPRKSVLKWLLNLMALVSHHGCVNKMSPAALGTVFAPTLTQPPISLDGFTAVTDTAKVLEKCIVAIMKNIDAESLERLFLA